MSSHWENFKKTSSLDEPISNPWDNKSTGMNNDIIAPNPTSPIMHQHSHNDDVASIISSLSGANSALLAKSTSMLGNYTMSNALGQGFNQGNFDEAIMSDSGSDVLNPNFRDALSAISAPVAAQPLNKSRFSSNYFGPASVAGINVSGFKTSNLGASNFLEKFASVTEKTRELELNSKQSPSVHHSGSNIGSRRSSIFNNDVTSPQQIFREPRKQSFSEKLDNYISATGSPSASRHLSFSSEANPTSEKSSAILDSNDRKNIWNPATATTFHPSGYNAFNGANSDFNFMQQQQQQMMIPPFAMGPPVNGGNFFPQMFPPFVPGGYVPLEEKYGKHKEEKENGGLNQNKGQKEGYDTVNENPKISFLATKAPESNTSYNNDTVRSNQTNGQIGHDQAPPGFFHPGLANRPISPFVIPPFNPYGMFNANSPNGGVFPAMVTGPGSPIGSPPPMMVVGGSPTSVLGMPPHSQNISKNMKDHSRTPPSSGDSRSLGSSNKKGGFTNNGKSPKFKNKHIVRSPLLEEFRNNKNNTTYTLKDITSHGYEFAKDQHGSRFIQQELATAPEDIKEAFFKEIRNHSVDLMTDVFGNYVIQKFFEHGSVVQKKVLFETMRGSFNSLSLQMYGCRVVQRCIEGIPLEDQLEIMEELKPNVLSLVKDQNGNHVIQKAIEYIPIDRIPFILDSLRHQIYHLSMHPYGCRVIQRLLECSGEEDQNFILEELKGFVYYLVQDQFGNYVIQHIIERGRPEYTDAILNVVLENLIELSKHKFASNAVEKCIINLPPYNRIAIYEVMLKDNMDKEKSLDERTNLSLMMKDPFANYVVQKMVELIDNERRQLLVIKIKQYLELIQNGHYSNKHLASIEKLNAICKTIDTN